MSSISPKRGTPTNVFADSGAGKRKTFMSILMLIPGSIAYGYGVYLLFLVAAESFEQKPNSSGTWFAIGLFAIALVIALYVAYLSLLTVLRVRKIESQANNLVITYAIGLSTKLERKSRKIKTSFLPDLEDEINWGCTARVFLSGMLPFVVAESMDRFDVVCAILCREPDADGV